MKYIFAYLINYVYIFHHNILTRMWAIKKKQKQEALKSLNRSLGLIAFDQSAQRITVIKLNIFAVNINHNSNYVNWIAG